LERGVGECREQLIIAPAFDKLVIGREGDRFRHDLVAMRAQAVERQVSDEQAMLAELGLADAATGRAMTLGTP
jgi:predicted transcriptional regulator